MGGFLILLDNYFHTYVSIWNSLHWSGPPFLAVVGAVSAQKLCKWVRYQKLHHFIEPYHAPYTANSHCWTGFLLLVHLLLSIISISSFDPQVNLMSTIFAVGVLIKGLTAKRIYKSWPLDIMETVIYFNIIVLTWYNLGSGGNQIAVAYMSVMITFILQSSHFTF